MNEVGLRFDSSTCLIIIIKNGEGRKLVGS